MSTRVLILGGTVEARQLAEKLSFFARFEVTLSLAGRTGKPAPQPVPVRVGGFGGAAGLAAYLVENAVDLLVDATHPYAARMSVNAAEASSRVGVPILALRRPAWVPQQGDRWHPVASVAAAVEALGRAPKKVFLALGRQDILPFETAPWHRYLIRSVDPVEPPLDVPDATYLLSRGPFGEDDEFTLLREHRIDIVICKNSGGTATYGKILAARRLGLPVVMVERPVLPAVPSATTVAQLVEMIDHFADPAAKRGV